MVFVLGLTSCQSKSSENREESESNTVIESSSYEDQLLILFSLYKRLQSSGIPEQELEGQLSLVTDPKLQGVKPIFREFIKPIPNLINHAILSKPNKNTLNAFANFSLLLIKSFSSQGVDLKSFIDTSLESKSEQDQLQNYYQIIFTRMKRVLDRHDLSNMNLNVQDLGFDNDQDLVILMLQFFNTYGGKYMRIVNQDCDKAKDYLARTPRIDNEIFPKYKLPKFEDFNVWIDNNKGKSSISKQYIYYYNKTKESYAFCNSN